MTDETVMPAWFAALGEEDQAECRRELRDLADPPDGTPYGHPGALEAALAAWKATGEAMADPVAREVLTSPLEPGDLVEAAPPLPPGQYARIELPGFRNHTGWITEETRFGAQAAVVRGRDGLVEAAVVLGPGCRIVYMPLPSERPEPPRAITSGTGPWGHDQDWSSPEDSDYYDREPWT